MPIIFATGPKVTKVSREQALAAVKDNPNFPKGGDDVTVEELDGHWVAAIHVADGNPFGQPADSSEGAPGPKSEGPDDTAPDKGPVDLDSDGDTDGDTDDDGDGPPKDDEKKDEKGGEKHELTAIHDAIQKILIALGIPDEEAPGASPLPGEDGPPAPPGPPGPAGPDQTVEHTKALKPGEVPPGGTPVGAPAFSHHITPHPWESIIASGVAATFETEERIPDDYTLADVDHELQELAHGTGFKVKQITESRNSEGHRIARALISAY